MDDDTEVYGLDQFPGAPSLRTKSKTVLCLIVPPPAYQGCSQTLKSSQFAIIVAYGLPSPQIFISLKLPDRNIGWFLLVELFLSLTKGLVPLQPLVALDLLSSKVPLSDRSQLLLEFVIVLLFVDQICEPLLESSSEI